MSESSLKGVRLELESEQGLSIETLPEYLDEDEVDDFLVRNGIIDKLLSQLGHSPHSKDWEAELNELSIL